jgi:hypothetical protein
MSWAGPSRANFSLNEDFIIVHRLHEDVCDDAQIVYADVVRSDALRLDVYAPHDERAADFLRFTHEEHFAAGDTYGDRHDRVFAMAFHQSEGDIRRSPSHILICHWRTTFNVPPCVTCKGRMSSRSRAENLAAS